MDETSTKELRACDRQDADDRASADAGVSDDLYAFVRLQHLSYATGRFQPRRYRVDRSAVELVTVSVGNAHCTRTRTQLRTNDAKFAREAVSLIDCVLCVFEDHSALAFEIVADNEIEIKVWHWNLLPSFQLHRI
jgi:hypothetical protein